MTERGVVYRAVYLLNVGSSAKLKLPSSGYQDNFWVYEGSANGNVPLSGAVDIQVESTDGSVVTDRVCFSFFDVDKGEKRTHWV